MEEKSSTSSWSYFEEGELGGVENRDFIADREGDNPRL